MAELNDEVHQQIERHSGAGNAYAEAGEYDKALREYEAGLNLLPEPAHEWEAWTWLKVAMADAYFNQQRYDDMHGAINEVVVLGGEENLANPFIQMRYGQALLEVGKEELAADWLARAFLSEGRQLFSEDDPKYLEFVCSRLRPPDGYSSWQHVFDKEERRPWWKFWG